MLYVILCLNILIYVGNCQKVSDNSNLNYELINRLKKTVEISDLEHLIIDILYERIYLMKCFVLICDQMYCKIFNSKIFKKFKTRVTYFLIKVEESEDLLSPYEQTQEVLNQIKAEDCNFYVILLANGLQTSRLLRFGDRYRVINTRANFILLYDMRLFNKNLYYLWKRIVNIIFIRQYGGKNYKREVEAIPWFDLSTVPFPSPIRNVFIPQRLDTWRKGHFRLGVDLFRDKTFDLRNQVLKVVTLQHIPATTKTYSQFISSDINSTLITYPIYSGVEIEILQTLSNKMNFETSIYEPINVDAEKWGQKQDGKFTGLIGEMVNFKAEIALGDLYYSPYHLDLMDLTVPYNTECLTFLTPESLTDKSWMTLILPFKIYMWLTVILVIFIVGFIFFALAKFQSYLQKANLLKTYIIVETKPTIPDYYPEKLQLLLRHIKFRKRKIQIVEEIEQPNGLYLFEQIFNTFLYTYSMLLLVSLPKIPDGWSLRMMVGWYWLYCTLVVVAYKASMTAILANPASKTTKENDSVTVDKIRICTKRSYLSRYYSEAIYKLIITIDSLEQLLESNLACGGWGENLKEFFLTSLDTASQEIGERFEHVNDTDLAIDRVLKGEFAYYENIYYLKAASVKRQLENKASKNNRNLHIMNNCVINMPISIGLQKNSPIKSKVDVFIQRVIESGFVKKWLDDVMQSTLTNQIHTESVNNVALMNLQKLYAGFVALFIGYFLSCATLIFELIQWNFVVRKHPHFNKYLNKIIIPVKRMNE